MITMRSTQNSNMYDLLGPQPTLVRVLTGDAALFSGWGVRI
jgi:hypothetical protein